MMFKAVVPASSANLGPGYDTLGLALGLHCRVEAQPSQDWMVVHLGPESYQGEEQKDAVLVAAQRVGGPLHMRVSNQIPLCSGLGSSAAAYAAGTLAALRAAGQDPSHDELFRHVKELEGHPDNAAAAVYGGLVAVVSGQIVRLALDPQLVPVLAVPGFELRTAEARQVVPSQVEMGTVVRTLGRMAALIEGLRAGSPQLLELAGGDELHEAPRATLDHRIMEIMKAAQRAGASYVCWSGSGPSVLSLVDGEHCDQTAQALGESLGPKGRVLVLSIDTQGAR